MLFALAVWILVSNPPYVGVPSVVVIASVLGTIAVALASTVEAKRRVKRRRTNRRPGRMH